MKRLILIAIIAILPILSACVPGDPIPDNLWTRNVYPGTNITYDIGSNDAQYNNGYFSNILTNGIPISNIYVPYAGALGNIDLATREISNGGLNAITASGIWTANGTWTIPDVTLGGTLFSNQQLISGNVTFNNTLTLPNNTAIFGRNTSNTTDVSLALVSTSNTPTYAVGSNAVFFNVVGVTMTLSTQSATAGATIRNSPTFAQRAAYWNGASSTVWDATSIHTMNATTPESSWDFKINGVGIMSLTNNNGTVGWMVNVDGTLKAVTVGINDSGGVGYKVLRVAN